MFATPWTLLKRREALDQRIAWPHWDSLRHGQLREESARSRLTLKGCLTLPSTVSRSVFRRSARVNTTTRIRCSTISQRCTELTILRSVGNFTTTKSMNAILLQRTANTDSAAAKPE